MFCFLFLWNKLINTLVLLSAVATCCCQNTSNVQRTLSVPIGAILPEGNPVANAVFKMALRNHNAQVATLTSSTDDAMQPFLQFRVFLQTSQVDNNFVIIQEFCNHVSLRTHSIIGYWDRLTVGNVLGHAKAFKIPWITPSLPASPIKSPFLISLHPRIAKLFPFFIMKHGWKIITYIYDLEGMHLSGLDLYEFGERNKIKILIRKLAGRSNVLPVLKDVFYNNERNVIIDVTLERSLHILSQIKAMEMMTSEFHYVFTDLNLINQNLGVFDQGAGNLTLFSLIDKKAEKYPGFMEEIDNVSFNSAADYITDSALLYDAFTAMAIGMRNLNGIPFQFGVEDEVRRQDSVRCNSVPSIPLRNGFEISQAIKQVQFKGLTGNVQFNQDGERVFHSIDIYSLVMNKMRKVGKWKDGLGDTGILVFNGSNDHKDLTLATNQTIIITTILEEPYMMLKESSQLVSGNGRYYGFCVDLLEAIAKIFPLNYRIKLVNDGNYGSKSEVTGKWNGMIGEVKYHKADMAVAPLTITSAREAVLEFTKPFMSLGISIMIKKPGKQVPSIFSFLEPLSYEIWICILFAYVGVSVVLYLVSKFSPYEYHKGSISGAKTNDEDASVDFTILNSLWFSIGSFVQQGCDVSPKSISGRLVGGVWWFFTLIIISSYTANLAAFLTVDRMESPISGAEDLVKQNTIKYGTLISGSTANFFKQSPLSTYEKMWSFMTTQHPSVFVNSNKEGIEKVRNSDGKYAFLMESSLNEYMEQRKPCNTMKVGPNIDAKGYGIALRKGSPLFDKVNLAILKLREQGALQKMKNYWWFEKSECGPSASSGPARTPALGLSNVAGVFYILIAGITLAVLLAIIEFAYYTTVLHRKAKELEKTRNGHAVKLDKKGNPKKDDTERFALPRDGDDESMSCQL